MKKRAFAVAAHPDDIEFVMSGTLIHLRDAGYEIHYMNIANGCCGSTRMGREELARVRRQESIEACAQISAVFHDSLVNDLEIFYDKPTLARLSSVMREVAPEILLVHAPFDYMEDHVNACRLAVSAAFTRNMPNFPVDPPRPAVEHSVTIYHAQPHGNRDQLGNLIRPKWFVQVDDVLEQKTDMLACHRSQHSWLNESQGLDSYIKTMNELMREVGAMCGRFSAAEGWRRHHTPGFCAPDADPLSVALEAHCFRSDV